MRWCVKKSTCKWCEQPVDNGTPVVTVFFWNKGNPDNRKWNHSYSYHPQCWLDQGLDYLGRNPYVPQVRRRSITLTVEDKRKRFLLIRRFNDLYHRKSHSKLVFPDNLLEDDRLTRKMLDILVEVATIGGVPKSWVEKLG